MATRKRGHQLERWEVAIAKAMLECGAYNDQDILAYFTRPTLFLRVLYRSSRAIHGNASVHDVSL